MSRVPFRLGFKNSITVASPRNDDPRRNEVMETGSGTVSYTHLTLPTKRIV